MRQHVAGAASGHESALPATYPERCQGHTRCYAVAPELFELDDLGNSHEVGDGLVPPELEAKALRLAAWSGAATPQEMQRAIGAIWKFAAIDKVDRLLG
jgi:ferredoxin